MSALKWSSVETECGVVFGVDLGSIATIDGEERLDRFDGSAEREAFELGLEIECHSMVSNGYDVRRFYLARKAQ